jgi:hypothetical protein
MPGNVCALISCGAAARPTFCRSRMRCKILLKALMIFSSFWRFGERVLLGFEEQYGVWIACSLSETSFYFSK